MTPRAITSGLLSMILLIPPTRSLLRKPFDLIIQAVVPSWGGKVPQFLSLVLGAVILASIVFWALRVFEKRLHLSESSSMVLKGQRNLGRAVALFWMIPHVFVVGFTDWIMLLGIVVIVGLSEKKQRPRPIPVVPVQPEPIPIPPELESDDEDVEIRELEWLFNEEPYRKSGKTHRFKLRVSVSRELYEEYKSRSHNVSSAKDFLRFATEELTDDLVLAITSKLRSIVIDHGFDRLAEIHLAMAFTLCIRYSYDQDDYGMEYPRYPIETIYDLRGDCDCHAILGGVLLYNLGHFTCLGFTPGHAFLGVEAPVPIEGTYFMKNGRRIYSCEVTPGIYTTTETTTSVQFWLGKAPHGGADGGKFFEIRPQ